MAGIKWILKQKVIMNLTLTLTLTLTLALTLTSPKETLA